MPQAHPFASPDNHLLEKAELLAKFSEKLKSEPKDVTSTPRQDSREKVSETGPGQVSSPASLRVKWQQEKKGLQLVCGEVSRVGSKNVGVGRDGPQKPDSEWSCFCCIISVSPP